jgi:hypothetical protein
MSVVVLTAWAYAVMTPLVAAYTAHMVIRKQWRWAAAGLSMTLVMIPLAVLSTFRCWS